MRNRMVQVLGIVGVAVAMMMLNGCGDDDSATGDETAATAEIQTLLEEYHAAFNDYDPEAFLGLVTAGYIQDREGVLVNATEMADEIGQLEEFDWSVALVGEPIMTGDGPWFVAQVNEISATIYGSDGPQSVSTFTVVDDGGTLKVSRHDYVGDN